MEQIEPPKSRLKVEKEMDRISNLPSGVIDKILSCLTLKEAARTAVLSSKWKNKWAMLSGLVFDDKCFKKENCETLVNIVYHVLLSHTAPIEKFVVSHKHVIPTRDIDRWVLHLSRNTIKVFELQIPDRPMYKLPSCFFSYQDMTELKLSHCLVNPPKTFQGFKTLKRVSFQSVTLDQHVLENLILFCPLLESLEIIDCGGFRHLKIDAPNLQLLSVSGGSLRDIKIDGPNLQSLSFSGLLRDFSLQNTLNLAVVRFNLSGSFRLDDVSSSNLAKFFVDLPHIQRLTIDGSAVKYLADGDLPRRLPKPCLDLSFLHLSVHFHDIAEILTTLCLLRSSPALKVFNVMVRHDKYYLDATEEEADSWFDNLDDGINCSFSNLRLVEITCLYGCKPELDFIRYLLLHSPVLETMTIRGSSAKGSSEILKKLLQFRRPLSVEIIYLDL